MKYLILMLLISFNLNARPISLEDQGFKTLKGEWTWVGKKLGIEKLRMVVTKTEVIKMEDVVGVNLKGEENIIENIKSLELDNRIISSKKFKAIILK